LFLKSGHLVAPTSDGKEPDFRRLNSGRSAGWLETVRAMTLAYSAEAPRPFPE
jgi:hypothetical protein